MNELRLDFLLEIATSFIVIYSIGALALGRAGLWVVGHAAFLGAGGIYAWSVQEYGLPGGSLITAVACLAWIGTLSLAAAYLKGDRFIMMSLAANYAVYMIFIGRFGEGVRNLPGASSPLQRLALVAFIVVFAVALGAYGVGMDRTRVNSSLLVARDQPWILEASRFPVPFLFFWMHFLSALVVCVAGLVGTLFYRAYSPNSHDISVSLVFFIVAIPFGLKSLKGGVIAALFLVSLHRLVDLVLSSASADHLYATWFGGYAGSASNLSGPIAEGLLAAMLIAFVRIRPQGIFGSQTRWLRK